MRKALIEKTLQRGSLMVEAIAMLGLIALVTPIIYKKAAERTTEMQDINEAGHLRVVSRAFDDFLKDNYAQIDVANAAPEELSEDDVDKVIEYMPEGYADAGSLSSKLFSNINFWVNEVDEVVDGSGNVTTPRILTGFIVAEPRSDVPPIRASRIASMIGTNGGYVPRDGTNILGAQGVWTLPKEKLGDPAAGSIVTTSMEGIMDVFDDDGVLYRKDKGDNVYNTMATTLYLDNNDIDSVGTITAANARAQRLGVGVDPSTLAEDSASIAGQLLAGSANIATGALEVIGGSDKKVNIGADTAITGKTTVGSVNDNLGGAVSPATNPQMQVGGGLETDELFAKTVNTEELEALTLAGGKENVDDATPTFVAEDGTVTIQEGTLELVNANIDSDIFKVNNTGSNQGVFIGNAEQVGFDADGNMVTESEIDAPYFDAVADNFTIGGDSKIVVNVTDADFEVATSDTATFETNTFQVGNTTTADILKIDTTDNITTKGVVNFSDGTNEILQVGGSVTTGAVGGKNPSIYIRDGGIIVAKDDAMPAVQDKFADGYIQVDRVISGAEYEDPYLGTGTRPGGDSDYDRYQVNPRYTSVMNDIKLSSRGGARLSDILPDFINKGVYVLDNTYKGYEAGGTPFNWQGLTLGTDKDFATTLSAPSCGTETTCETSPWLGFVPSPSCPPGYSRLAYITPLRFNVAKAYGINYFDDTLQLLSIYNPTVMAQDLGFQGGTWLNMSLQSNDGDFKGWHALMGLIYPAAYYAEFIHNYYSAENPNVLSDLDASCTAAGAEFDPGVDGVNAEGDCVLWNMLPVYNKEMAATVNVYCYFDRSSFDPAVVDDYDQLTNFRDPNDFTAAGQDKSNLNNLNESGKYTDPW